MGLEGTGQAAGHLSQALFLPGGCSVGEVTKKWAQAGPSQASSCHNHTQKAGTHTVGLVSGYKANLPLQMSKVKGLGVWGYFAPTGPGWGGMRGVAQQALCRPQKADRGLLPHGQDSWHVAPQGGTAVAQLNQEQRTAVL